MPCRCNFCSCRRCMPFASQSHGSYRVLSFLLTILMNSPVDQRRSQDLPMAIGVSVSATPSVIAGQRLCQPIPSNRESRTARLLPGAIFVDNPASPQIANARTHSRKLGGCTSKKHRPKLQAQCSAPAAHLSSLRRHRDIT